MPALHDGVNQLVNIRLRRSVDQGIVPVTGGLQLLLLRLGGIRDWLLFEGRHRPSGREGK